MQRPERWPAQSEASFLFRGTLSDFLPPAKRARAVPYAFRGTPSVKDAMEALGVPHVEVDAVFVNGESTPFDHPLCDGDQVRVCPLGAPPEGGRILHLQAPLPGLAFVADVHLRRLARTLRLLGFDTLHCANLADADIVRVSREDRRIVLTRDRQVLKHGDLAHGYWVRSTDPETQAREVVGRFGLAAHARPFTRCIVCNGLLRRADKDAVRERIPPRTALWLDEYRECPVCRRLYWRGTHGAHLQGLVESALRPPP